MALWSLMINLHGAGSFGTQLKAPTPNRALRQFVEGNSLPKFLRTAGPGWPTAFSLDDVVVFIPMDGLQDMHLCQIGKDGKYANIMLVKTTEAGKPNSRLNRRAATTARDQRQRTDRRSPKR